MKVQFRRRVVKKRKKYRDKAKKYLRTLCILLTILNYGVSLSQSVSRWVIKFYRSDDSGFLFARGDSHYPPAVAINSQRITRDTTFFFSRAYCLLPKRGSVEREVVSIILCISLKEVSESLPDNFRIADNSSDRKFRRFGGYQVTWGMQFI